MKTILITGGMGYIGGRISHFLEKHAPNTRVFMTARRMPHHALEWTKNISVMAMDVCRMESVKNCLQQVGNVDAIVHLAALNENDSLKDPARAFEVNTRGTLNLLLAASEKKMPRFMYFSTFHVYGKPDVNVITEQTPTFPFHPYAYTHRAAEDVVRSFNYYSGMQTLIFRLSNGYGYPMHKDVDRWTLVFNDLCRQAVTTGKIALRSSGREHRDFISLENAARAVFHFLFEAADKWGDGLFNLGGECSLSILDVADRVRTVYRKRYGKDVASVDVPEEQEKSVSAYAPVRFSVDKLKAAGFSLVENMDEEIDKTMELCKGFLSAVQG